MTTSQALIVPLPLPTLPTQAGLRGINLSGGQRQRLNLARAAYFDGDLVLLVSRQGRAGSWGGCPVVCGTRPLCCALCIVIWLATAPLTDV